MEPERVSLTEAKQRLSELVRQVAYGGKRFILEFRGKPRAVLLSLNNLVERIGELRRRIQRESGFISTAELLEETRQGRDEELAGLR